MIFSHGRGKFQGKLSKYNSFLRQFGVPFLLQNWPVVNDCWSFSCCTVSHGANVASLIRRLGGRQKALISYRLRSKRWYELRVTKLADLWPIQWAFHISYVPCPGRQSESLIHQSSALTIRRSTVSNAFESVLVSGVTKAAKYLFFKFTLSLVWTFSTLYPFFYFLFFFPFFLFCLCVCLFVFFSKNIQTSLVIRVPILLPEALFTVSQVMRNSHNTFSDILAVT